MAVLLQGREELTAPLLVGPGGKADIEVVAHHHHVAALHGAGDGTVLVPAGYPAAKAAIEKAGYPVIEVDTSEFRKIDGGLSCLSLRF